MTIADWTTEDKLRLEILQLRAQKAEMLEALKDIMEWERTGGITSIDIDKTFEKANALIALTTEAQP